MHDSDQEPNGRESALPLLRDGSGRFAVGGPGNPHAPGRRPGQPELLTAELRRLLSTPGDHGEDYRAQLARQLLELALGGDLDAIIYIYNRVDGRPRETIDHGGDLGLLVQVVPWVRREPPP